MEPDKCEGWQWADWNDIPRPAFQGLHQLLEATAAGDYDPFRTGT